MKISCKGVLRPSWNRRVAGLVLFLMIASGAYGGEVVTAVLSSDMESFRQAYEGFRACVAEKRPSARISEVNVKGHDSAWLQSRLAVDKPALVLAVGSDALKMLRETGRDVPVVFCMVVNVQEYAGPNTAGVSLDIPADMKLQGIQKIIPGVKRIGMLYSPATVHVYEETLENANRLGLRVVGKRIDSDKDLAASLREIANTDCFLMIIDSRIYFSQTVKFLLLESLRARFPVVGLSSFYTKGGALVSFDCDYEDLGMQAGEIGLRILSGEKLTGQKAVRPRKVRYSINLITAEKLGVRVPPQAVKDAAEVFSN